MAATQHLDLTVSQAFAATYPGACVGAPRMTGVRNPESDPLLDALLDQTAAHIRDRHAGLARLTRVLLDWAGRPA